MGEHSRAVGERLTPLCERRVVVIPAFTGVGERFCDFGESFTDVGQNLTDRGSPFAKAGKTMNAVALPPFEGGSAY
jgi:hypothetical protein